jgi:hypothetical protein
LGRPVFNQSDKPGERKTVALREAFQKQIQFRIDHQFLPAVMRF